MLAYVRDEARVRVVLGRAGFTDVVLVERDATYCFVARAADFTIVSFRGTDTHQRVAWCTMRSKVLRGLFWGG